MTTGRTVLITGAAGLLGGWLTRQQLAAGSRVIVIRRDVVPGTYLETEGLLTKAVVCDGDISDLEFLLRILNEYEVDTVFHLAAQAIVPTANRQPLSTFESNIRGTWTLLEAIRLCPVVTATVVSTSDKAYGPSLNLPYREDHALQGRTPYEVSKSCADLIAQSYAHTWGMNIAIARCGNLYGAGDLNPSRLIPGVITDILRQRRPVIRSDGTPVRDYLYVADAVDAFVRLESTLRRDPSIAGTAFNLSGEHPVAVLEIVTRLLTIMQSDLEPDVRNEATNEIDSQQLDCTKARTVLGWTAPTSLDDGLSETVAWYRQHG